ncbi:KpsF/GutQ family sugar-phosphate isomerase [Solitalea canadensis]|uniref:KpsF/GutQ family protein n=1 Tax=Solitalea canadensis (strain ATCC 29591 / DSM 3403 / JCM 21819 / LMG 8368 / NBRC 15130 / NCIMB 12057 / USAM 9D) TaxID=929556 RepID=H8KQU9_SOLCM|nr:KpsF/GutQ family sugar-phosphate isomerase [Solitalea canadensis]AFD06970.1 KpsF/GutQ family protein [Solitalea canadensis DSM 3403]
MNKLQVLESAKRTLQIEADALLGLQTYINNDFETIVNIILNSKGRVVITGIGKSAIIAQKIVATMNSTGTPALYMHAADAIHGDLGMIQKDDVTICISKSGNTPEIKVLVPLLKTSGNVLIGMAGDMKSYLATHSDYVLNTTVETEACPLNLAPTTSTTAQLAMGDALAVCLLQQRNFTSQDFARYHPGGALGKRLYLKVKDLSSNNQKPEVAKDDDIKRVIVEISSKRLGSTAVVDNEHLVGVITDGDLRRMMEKNENFSTLRAVDIMNSQPKTVEASAMAVDALALMKQYNISQLIVVDKNKYAGIIHLHDLIKEGII